MVCDCIIDGVVKMPLMSARLQKYMQAYNPSVSFADSSPYTGEPIGVRADPIQRHRPMPPLCKAPEAAVQRRCGDHVSGGRVVKTLCVKGRGWQIVKNITYI